MDTNVPTSIVIFGITGDLAQKKILPALFDLYVKKQLPEKTRIIGFSRRPWNTQEIHQFVQSTLPETSAPKDVSDFLEIVTYVQGNFNDLESYRNLAKHLLDLDIKYNDGCSNKLFYLSVPPTLYENIATHVSASGLSIPCGGVDGYARILVEKPFGKDLYTAEKLDELFGSLFKEEQIFRIDHYLAKESLYNIINIHRQNDGLAREWNKDHISLVEINLFETAVIGSRGAFYDGIGALRDVGQNHMLQMLALVTMKIPDVLTPENIQHGRQDALKHLVPPTTLEIFAIKRGQYEGYVSEPGVAPDSTTETFFSLTAYMDTEDFSGVPFTLTSGKALSKNLTEIIITHKDGKKIVFTVPPIDSLPAYQKILLDCIAGDQTVFISTGEIMAEWAYVTPIINTSSNTKPFIYPKGSDAEILTK